MDILPTTILFFLLNYSIFQLDATTLPLYQAEEVFNLAANSHCLVLFPAESNVTDWRKNVLQTIAYVSFFNESKVIVGTGSFNSFLWPNGEFLKIGGKATKSDLLNSFLIFKPIKKDRTCLLLPEKKLVTPDVVLYTFSNSENENILNDVILFINNHCNTFRNKDGKLNVAGIHRRHILENIFRVPQPIVNTELNVLSDSCMVSDSENKDDCKPKGEANAFHGKYIASLKEVQQCDKITMPSSSEFFHEYVSLSKPVIITEATGHWAAFNKWTNDFLRENYGSKKVHIKMTPDGIYEGVEPKSMWEDKESKPIPQSVLQKLSYPDLVVVRPATDELLFSEFLDLIENIAQGTKKNISAYLEYSSIADYFPELREDISEMTFFKNVLELKHLNIWLSDGNTLGKLHFDPFDNFLCQISGKKEVLLYEPHDNTKLYEGHVQEAMFTYDHSSHSFRRNILLDSTSMVMSPVDIRKPDLKRFPKFADLQPLNCTIEAGEVLFMPAFWWHEVQSRPSASEHRNLAVNFWYEPFLTREFPCPECPLDVNTKYFHLL